MTALYNVMYNAAEKGDLERVILLMEQGAYKNQTGGLQSASALCIAAEKNHLNVVRYLVEQGADMEMEDRYGMTPLINASFYGHIEVVRYLLEQGGDRDKATEFGMTSLHSAVEQGQLETAKLLMVYGADLNIQDYYGRLPIDVAWREDIRQAISEEPRRRMDEAPGKRATEQDRHPNAATPAYLQQEIRCLFSLQYMVYFIFKNLCYVVKIGISCDTANVI